MLQGRAELTMPSLPKLLGVTFNQRPDLLLKKPLLQGFSRAALFGEL